MSLRFTEVLEILYTLPRKKVWITFVEQTGIFYQWLGLSSKKLQSHVGNNFEKYGLWVIRKEIPNFSNNSLYHYF